MNSLNWKKVLISGIVFAVLVVMLAVGVYLVRKPQSQSVSSKASGCVMLWPAKPGTICANTKLSPAMNATNVSLTPDFIWDYGGYRDGDTGQCVQPSGCTGYYANVSVWEGTSTSGTRVMGCGAVQDSNGNPPKACNWVSFYASPLKPNTQYTWRVEPGTNETGSHAEHTWNYTFTTGSGTQTVACNQTCDATHLCPTGLSCDTVSGTCRNSACSTQTTCVCPTPAGACQRVTASKDLSTIKIGDTVTFTGYGNLTNPPTGDSIDKINFIISKDGAEASNTEVATTLDSAGVWKATKDFSITSPGSYSVRIRVHWLSTDRWLE